MYKSFLKSVSQGSRNKSKTKQMGPNQIYKLLPSKWNHKQREKTTYGMGENICKQCDQQEFDFQNIQKAQITHNK